MCVVLPDVSVPKEAAVEKRLLDDAIVEKRVVEVALVVVALRAVTFWSEETPPTVSDPFALSAPPTLSNEETVVDPVTASVPLDVAPVVVSPPLNATSVEVAPDGNG